jgi:hypothetical protein
MNNGPSPPSLVDNNNNKIKAYLLKVPAAVALACLNDFQEVLGHGWLIGRVRVRMLGLGLEW